MWYNEREVASLVKLILFGGHHGNVLSNELSFGRSKVYVKARVPKPQHVLLTAASKALTRKDKLGKG